MDDSENVVGGHHCLDQATGCTVGRVFAWCERATPLGNHVGLTIARSAVTNGAKPPASG